jgi:hypothetical protein
MQFNAIFIIKFYIYNFFSQSRLIRFFFFFNPFPVTHLSNEIYLVNESTIFASQLSLFFSLIFFKKKFLLIHLSNEYILQMNQQYLFNNEVCSSFKFIKFLILFAKKHSFGK